MRITDELERIFVKDREDLARLVGYLLGCHDYHSFFVNVDTLSVDLYQHELVCATGSGVGWVRDLANTRRTTRTPPPPPPPF